MRMSTSLILFLGIVGSALSLQASPLKYTFTFDATSHSALTSFSLVSPTLITGSPYFVASQLQLVSPPAVGAGFLVPFPAATVDYSGKVSALFTKGSGSNITDWEFSGLTAELKGPGTYMLLTGSTVYSNQDARDVPVEGSVVISSTTATATAPEPGSFLLLGVGIVAVGSVVGGRRRLRKKANASI